MIKTILVRAVTRRIITDIRNSTNNDAKDVIYQLREIFSLQNNAYEQNWLTSSSYQNTTKYTQQNTTNQRESA